MRAAIIVDGKVDNIIEVESLDLLEGVTLVEAPTASIGDRWDGENFIQPDSEPTTRAIPSKVTRRQARQALLLAGRLADVQPAIDAIADPVQRGLAQIEWEDSLEFERARPLVIEISTAIGLDELALDQLFITAAGL